MSVPLVNSEPAAPAQSLSRAEKLALALILLAGLLVRGAVLSGGQRYLRSDEAVVGLMAKHIVTRGERPLFLYGQLYGGGHAMEAWIAAPFFAIFGLSSAALTAIPAFFSLLNILLVWRILRTYAGKTAALAGAALYGFTPPILYQAFLVNGGTETFFLALTALLFFLRVYLGGSRNPWNALAAGVFGGLATWGMDYAALYAAVFALLLAITWPPGAGRTLFRLCAGFILGCMPLIYSDFMTNFAHLRAMAGGPKPENIGIAAHAADALGGFFRGELAAFYTGNIDDFARSTALGWPRAIAVWAALAVALAASGKPIWEALRAFVMRNRPRRALPWPAIPVVFIVIYMAIYSLAGYSTPQNRTPRYLLPLCPFASMCIAWAVALLRPGWRRILGWIAVALLVAPGLVCAEQLRRAATHEEHRIATSGPEIHKLAATLRAHGVRYAFAPYEIQWRIMFETDEEVLVSSQGISPTQRYRWYNDAVTDAVWNKGEPCAFIFRKRFDFAEWAAARKMGAVTEARWKEAFAQAGGTARKISAGDEFDVYFPLTSAFLGRLNEVISGKQ